MSTALNSLADKGLLALGFNGEAGLG